MTINICCSALSSVHLLDMTLQMKLRYAKGFYPDFYPCSIFGLCHSMGGLVRELMMIKILLNVTCYFCAQIRTG